MIKTSVLSRQSSNGLAALELSQEYGWVVLPLHSIEGDRCSCGVAGCSSPGKHPRTQRGLHDASRHPEQVCVWWDRWPSANIGLVTGEPSGVVVVDVDGPEGIESLARYGTLPKTIVQTTGRGRHLLFARGVRIANNAGRLGRGLDVRGDGGYIVVAPSTHICGSAYQWSVGCSPRDRTPAALPDAFRRVLESPAPAPPDVTASALGSDYKYGRRPPSRRLSRTSRFTS